MHQGSDEHVFQHRKSMTYAHVVARQSLCLQLQNSSVTPASLDPMNPHTQTCASTLCERDEYARLPDSQSLRRTRGRDGLLADRHSLFSVLSVFSRRREYFAEQIPLTRQKRPHYETVSRSLVFPPDLQLFPFFSRCDWCHK